jgi:3-deoxy-7-phosphoheptulonate synthase
MTDNRIFDLNIRGVRPLPSPRISREGFPATERSLATVTEGREAVRAILDGEDKRLLLIVGPCSIHDPEAARDYARRLAAIRESVSDSIALIMRVYFEKPRTTVGWKGLVSDPRLDGSNQVEEGLQIARELLIDINDMGLPAATEFLDSIVPQYLAEFIAWAAIGARTTESQTHREMASGLSMPVGFKNGTDGSLQIAVDAMVSARTPHTFLGMDIEGHVAVMQTTGNRLGHMVMRGGSKRPNYDPEAIAEARERLRAAGLPEHVLVDCSHANSGKKHERQEMVLEAILEQRSAGDGSIIGAMLESNIHEGAQKVANGREGLRYGVSITDECISWETTERLIKRAAECIRTTNPRSLAAA